MDRCQCQTVLDLEFQVEIVCDIAHIVEVAEEQFDILLLQTPGVRPRNLKLLLTLHTGRH